MSPREFQVNATAYPDGDERVVEALERCLERLPEVATRPVVRRNAAAATVTAIFRVTADAAEEADRIGRRVFHEAIRAAGIDAARSMVGVAAVGSG